MGFGPVPPFSRPTLSLQAIIGPKVEFSRALLICYCMSGMVDPLDILIGETIILSNSFVSFFVLLRRFVFVLLRILIKQGRFRFLFFAIIGSSSLKKKGF